MVSCSEPMTTLIRDLIRPYRGTLAVVLFAMLVETAMSLIGPWPLKVVIDNVIGRHKLPHTLAEMMGRGLPRDQLRLAGLAAAAFVVFALVGAAANYIDNYY